MDALGNGLIALSYHLSQNSQLNRLRVITRSKKDMFLSDVDPTLYSAIVQTKETDDGTKAFLNVWEKLKFFYHLKNDGSYAVFPAGTDKNFGMLKIVYPESALWVARKAQKRRLCYVAFVTEGEDLDIKTSKIKVGLINLPKITSLGKVIRLSNEKSSELSPLARASDLFTQYALAKIAENVSFVYRGEYQDPDNEIKRIIIELSEIKELHLSGGFFDEEITRLGLSI